MRLNKFVPGHRPSVTVVDVTVDVVKVVAVVAVTVLKVVVDVAVVVPVAPSQGMARNRIPSVISDCNRMWGGVSKSRI